jgi:hypothetical protein
MPLALTDFQLKTLMEAAARLEQDRRPVGAGPPRDIFGARRCDVESARPVLQ